MKLKKPFIPIFAMGAVIVMSNATIANSKTTFDYDLLGNKDSSYSPAKLSKNSFYTHTKPIAQASNSVADIIKNRFS